MGEALLVLQNLAKVEVIMIEWLICRRIDRVLLTDPYWHTQTQPVLSPGNPSFPIPILNPISMTFSLPNCPFKWNL